MGPYPETKHQKEAGGEQQQQQQQEEEEEDYMSAVFTAPDATRAASWSGSGRGPAPETSLQRRERQRREGEQRARPKSKAELAAEAAAARETALSRSLLENGGGKGLAMMARMGFRAGDALGRGADDAVREPIRLHIKEDRGGIGLDAERKRKAAEQAERAGGAAAAAKAPRIDEAAFRERVCREREQARLERMVGAAQKVAEGMDEERGGEGAGDEEGVEDGAEAAVEERRRRRLSTRRLKSINVLWRGPVRAREEAERDRRMRHDLEQSLSRLPTYEADDEDEDDRRAMGKIPTAHVPVEDLEEEDAELDAFDALEAGEKLRRIVEYLRAEYHYCFFCKYTYPDETMDGCPGLTEADHD